MKKACLFLSLTVLPLSLAMATHLISGHITFQKQGTGNHTYLVTITVFTNTGSEIRFGDGLLDFGDGSQPHITPLVENTPLPGHANIGYVTYSVSYTFPGNGAYLVTYSEPNMMAGMLNVFNSVETVFHLESTIILDGSSDSSSPEFLTVPAFYASLGNELQLSMQVTGNEDDRYHYYLLNPVEWVDIYQLPEGVSINPYNGEFTWNESGKFNNSFTAGIYFFVVKVIHMNAEGKALGSVTASFTIAVEDNQGGISSDGSVPDPNGRIIVPDNEERTYKFILSDANTSTGLDWEAYSADGIASSIELTEYDSTSGSIVMRVGLLTVTYNENIDSDYYFPITLRGSSDSEGKRWTHDVCLLLAAEDIPLFDVIAGVEKTNAVNQSIYPVPVVSEFYVDGMGTGEAQVDIINLQGRLCHSTTVRQGESVSAHWLQPGIYIIRISQGGSVRYTKVLKQ